MHHSAALTVRLGREAKARPADCRILRTQLRLTLAAHHRCLCGAGYEEVLEGLIIALRRRESEAGGRISCSLARGERREPEVGLSSDGLVDGRCKSVACTVGEGTDLVLGGCGITFTSSAREDCGVGRARESGDVEEASSGADIRRKSCRAYSTRHKFMYVYVDFTMPLCAKYQLSPKQYMLSQIRGISIHIAFFFLPILALLCCVHANTLI